jgi:hypothetical protein
LATMAGPVRPSVTTAYLEKREGGKREHMPCTSTIEILVIFKIILKQELPFVTLL